MRPRPASHARANVGGRTQGGGLEQGMTTSELIRRMVTAHSHGDAAAFERAVLDLIGEERRKNHPIFAQELERLLANGNGGKSSRQGVLDLLESPSAGVPRDADRDAPLIEMVTPRRELSELTLSEVTLSSVTRVIEEQRANERLRSKGLRPSNRLLFFGPPGCGKTVTAEAMAKTLFLPLALVRFDAVVSSYLGETASNLRKVFDFARRRPMLLFFDEVDAIGKKRDDADDHGELKRVVSAFLLLLDRFTADTVTIAATNHEALLDIALWRRFDEVIYFPRPEVGEIEMLLARYFRQIDSGPDVHWEKIAGSLVGLSHADVERVAFRVLKEMLLRRVERVEPNILSAVIHRERDRAALITHETKLGATRRISTGKAPKRKPKA